MDVQRQGLLTLVRSGLTGESLPLPEGLDLEKVYPELVRHQVLALGYLGAVNCGVSKKEPVVGKLFQAYCKSLDHSEKQQKLVEAICAAFDRAGVDYMPLKGCNMKGLYPAPELRAMGDADILIRVEQYERIEPALLELGFVETLDKDPERVWDHKNLHLELHKRLFAASNKDFYRYFGDGWRRAVVQNGTRWMLKPEDELVYLLTHFAKHYRNGGIGLRHLADMWVFLQANPQMDVDETRRELKKLRLLEFYDNVMNAAQAWLGAGEWDEKSLLVINRVCGSGSFGTRSQHDLSDIIKEAGANRDIVGTRCARALRIVFLSRIQMEMKYPVLKKLPILLPLFWLVRIFNVLLFKQNRVKEAAHRFQRANNHAVDRYQQEMNFVGLKFDFEE